MSLILSSRSRLLLDRQIRMIQQICNAMQLVFIIDVHPAEDRIDDRSREHHIAQVLTGAGALTRALIEIAARQARGARRTRFDVVLQDRAHQHALQLDVEDQTRPKLLLRVRAAGGRRVFPVFAAFDPCEREVWAVGVRRGDAVLEGGVGSVIFVGGVVARGACGSGRLCRGLSGRGCWLGRNGDTYGHCRDRCEKGKSNKSKRKKSRRQSRQVREGNQKTGGRGVKRSTYQEVLVRCEKKVQNACRFRNRKDVKKCEIHKPGGQTGEDVVDSGKGTRPFRPATQSLCVSVCACAGTAGAGASPGAFAVTA